MGPQQAVAGSNYNEVVYHTPHISRTGTLPSDAVSCHILENDIFLLECLIPSVEDIIIVFQSLLTKTEAI